MPGPFRWEGKHYHLRVVNPWQLPLQKPHPPIWYGAHAPDSAARAARRALNVVTLDPTPEARLAMASYYKTWHETHGATPLPKLGLGRFVVVAETDAQALRLARRAYPVWHESFTHLFRLRGRPQNHPRPSEFDDLMERGQGVAGSPETVAHYLAAQLAETGCNYVVGQFAFGDLTRDECLHSIDLFTRKVMPALRSVIPGPSVARNPESIATSP